jgi:hypothetical protein
MWFANATRISFTDSNAMGFWRLVPCLACVLIDQGACVDDRRVVVRRASQRPVDSVMRSVGVELESMTYFTMYSENFCWVVRTLAHRRRRHPGEGPVAGDRGRAGRSPLNTVQDDLDALCLICLRQHPERNVPNSIPGPQSCLDRLRGSSKIDVSIQIMFGQPRSRTIRERRPDRRYRRPRQIGPGIGRSCMRGRQEPDLVQISVVPDSSGAFNSRSMRNFIWPSSSPT